MRERHDFCGAATLQPQHSGACCRALRYKRPAPIDLELTDRDYLVTDALHHPA